MSVSSKQLRKQVIASLAEYASNNPEDYSAYMVACSVAWFYRDSATGMSTINQVNVTNLVHEQIQKFSSAREEDESLNAAHYYVHQLRDYLVKKLMDKGVISADDHDFTDDGTLAKHESDFAAWAAELPPFEDEKEK